MTATKNHTYRIDIAEQHEYLSIVTSDVEAALDEAAEEIRGNVETYDVDGNPILRTSWEEVRATNEEDEDDSGYRKVSIEPDEPDCATGHEHKWETPIELVGGCKENPGVRSSGGGVECTSVCVHCGCARITDSWAQDPATGQQGLQSVEYRVEEHRVEECERCVCSLLEAQMQSFRGDSYCAKCIRGALLVWIAEGWAELPESEQTDLLGDAADMEGYGDALVEGYVLASDEAEKLVEVISAWREDGGQDAWCHDVEVPLREHGQADDC